MLWNALPFKIPTCAHRKMGQPSESGVGWE